MDTLKKNPIASGVIAIAIIVVFFAGLYFLVIKKSPEAVVPHAMNQSEQIQKIKPEDIGMTITPRADNKAVTLELTKLAGITSFEYSIDYNANVKDDATGQMTAVPRGVEGTIDVKPTDSSIKREIELGTCSRNVCKYDDIVSGVKFTVKVTHSDGKIAGLEQTINLPGTSANQ